MKKTKKTQFLQENLRNVMLEHVGIVVGDGKDRIHRKVREGLGGMVRERVRDEVRNNANSAMEEKLKARQ